MQYPLVMTNYTSTLVLEVTRRLLKLDVDGATVLVVINAMLELMETNGQAVAEQAEKDRALRTALGSWITPDRAG